MKRRLRHRYGRSGGENRYTVFTRKKNDPHGIHRVQRSLTFSEARDMCQAHNSPDLNVWWEFDTDTNFARAWPRAARRG